MLPLKIQAILNDIEPKQDKNNQPFFILRLTNCPNYFYAFKDHLDQKTFQTLKAPERLVGQSARLTYEELPDKYSPTTFLRVKAIEIIPNHHA